MNKKKHKSKTASLMLFSFAYLALTGCTLHDTLNKPQAETIVDVVEQPQLKRNMIKRDAPNNIEYGDTITLSVDYDYAFLSTFVEKYIPNYATSPSEDTYYTVDATATVVQHWNQQGSGTNLQLYHKNPHTDKNNGIELRYTTSGVPQRPYTIFTIYPQNESVERPIYITDQQTDAQANYDISNYSLEFYNNLFNIQPQPEEESMGEQIIDSVESGLGMIGALATEFLTGFTALFWNSTNSQLTAFGTFSLVFLGIAITFAIIKLILNIVRSNTGV